MASDTGAAALVLDLAAQTGEGAVKTLTHAALIQALAKMGDRATEVVCWVMHSKPYFDLVGAAVSGKLLEVTAGTIYGGQPGTFGRPVLVTDSPALVLAPADADDPVRYRSFGLTAGAVDVIESEERSILLETLGGRANLTLRYQGEFAYSVRVKAGAWKTAKAHPGDADLADPKNWVPATSQVKALPGVMLISL